MSRRRDRSDDEGDGGSLHKDRASNSTPAVEEERQAAELSSLSSARGKVPTATPPTPALAVDKGEKGELSSSPPRSQPTLSAALVSDSPRKETKVTQVQDPTDPTAALRPASTPPLAPAGPDEEQECSPLLGYWSTDEDQDSSSSSTAQLKKTKEERQEKHMKKQEEKMYLHKPLLPPASPPPSHGIKLLKTTQEGHSVDNLRSQLLSFLRCGDLHQRHHAEPVLVIDFRSLFLENKELACIICNGGKSRTDAWVTRDVRNFHEGNGCPPDTKFHFINQPESCHPVKEFLSSPHKLTGMVPVFKGGNQVMIETATFHGQTLFRMVLCSVLEQIAQGESWDGQLTIDDIYIAEVSGGLKVMITKEPIAKENVLPLQKVSDISSIWTMMGGFFSHNGRLPLYFEKLRKDLTTFTAEEVEESWFLEYLRFHPAFASSTARRNLVTGLYSMSRVYRFAKKSQYKLLFEGIPKPDWRMTAEKNNILQITLHYRREQQKPSVFNNPDQVLILMKGETRQVVPDSVDGYYKTAELVTYSEVLYGRPAQVCVWPVIEPEVWPVIEPVVEEEGDKKPVVEEDDYLDSRDELLRFNRHSLSHISDRIPTNTLDDVELFNASFFPNLLPDMTKGVLQVAYKTEDNKIDKKFRSLWTAYQACVRSQKDDE